MGFVSDSVRTWHPEYYSIETYPADRVARIHKVDQQWGDFSNFGRIPVTVGGVVFSTSERLYQIMKFTDPEARKAVYAARQPKMQAKHQFKLGKQRADWGRYLVDAMKFCLMRKWEQSEKFRTELAATAGLFIVEDQTTFPGEYANSWGAKLSADGRSFVGPNLLGRLLMELRDNGRLDYELPADYVDFSDLR